MARPNLADTVDRLSRMPAGDRERALSGLPADQQKQISSGIGRLEQLNPADREQLLNRYRHFENLDAHQKDQVRKVVRQFRSLPEARRAAVKGELDTLDKLSPAERTRRLNNEEFRNEFNRAEREILENTSSALLGRV